MLPLGGRGVAYLIDYHERPPSTERPSRFSRARSLYAYAIGVLLLLSAVAGVLIWYTGNLDRDLVDISTVPKPTSAGGLAPTAQKKPAATAASTTTSAPTSSSPRLVKVANTGGLGANLRSEPSTSAARIASLVEGAVLEVVGPDVQAEGRTWKNVKDEAGRTGWMAADFLVPVER